MVKWERRPKNLQWRIRQAKYDRETHVYFCGCWHSIRFAKRMLKQMRRIESLDSQ